MKRVSDRALGLRWGRMLAWLGEAAQSLKRANGERMLLPEAGRTALADALERVCGLERWAWKVEEEGKLPGRRT